jgi:hypothetical protein
VRKIDAQLLFIHIATIIDILKERMDYLADPQILDINDKLVARIITRR